MISIKKMSFCFYGTSQYDTYEGNIAREGGHLKRKHWEDMEVSHSVYTLADCWNAELDSMSIYIMIDFWMRGARLLGNMILVGNLRGVSHVGKKSDKPSLAITIANAYSTLA